MATYVHDPDDLTPLMTANDAPSPNVASASTEFISNYAYRAFNHSAPTDWIGTNPSNSWLKFDLGAGNGAAVYKYTLSTTGSSNNRMVKDWTFQGSNNDADWTTLDTRTNESSWAANEMRTYEFSNSNGYRYYRVLTTANNGDGTYVAIGEVELMGTTPLVIKDLKTEIAVELTPFFIDLKSNIEATHLTDFLDLLSDIQAVKTRLVDLKSETAADFLTDFANLSTEISAKAQQILNLFTEIKAGNQIISDLFSSITTIFGSVTDLKSEIQGCDIIVLDLYTDIRAARESLSDINFDISVIYPTREKFLLLRHDHIPVRNEQNVPIGRAMQFCLYNPDPAFGIDLTTFKLRFDEGTWYRYGNSRLTFTEVSYRECKIYFNPPNFLYDREIMIEVYCEDHRNNPGIKLEIL